jgi:hypothetical protein
VQVQINAIHAEREAKREVVRRGLDQLQYEMLHNLVVETTRMSIEVKNLKMRVESMSSRLDFDERRARALEGVVQYRPGAVAPLQPPAGGGDRDRSGPIGQVQGQTADAERRSRRRRRRGRRRPGSPPGPGGERQAGPGGSSDAAPTEGGGSFESRTRSGDAGGGPIES